jgi:hypothetical protein
VADAICEEGPERLQFDLPGDQADVSGSMKIFEDVDIHVGKLGDALRITERNQQSQLGAVLAPSSVFDDATKIAALINLAVIPQELIYCFRNSPACCARARLAFRVINPALLIEPPNQRGESAVRELAACCSKGLADPRAVMEAIDVKRTIALISSDFSAAAPEKFAASEMTPEGI